MLEWEDKIRIIPDRVTSVKVRIIPDRVTSVKIRAMSQAIF